MEFSLSSVLAEDSVMLLSALTSSCGLKYWLTLVNIPNIFWSVQIALVFINKKTAWKIWAAKQIDASRW